MCLQARGRCIAVGLAMALAAIAPPSSASADDRVAACVKLAEDGQVARQSSHLTAARALFLRCSDRTCPAAVQRDCERWFTEVEADQPSIVLRVRDAAGNDRLDAAVYDGETRIAGAVPTTALTLDPGEHHLRVEMAGMRSAVRDVVAREGERGRVIDFRLDPLAPPSPATHVEGVAPERRSYALPIGILATGTIAIAVGAYFDGRGYADYLDARDQCEPRCASSTADAIRAKLLIGDLLIGAGLATAAAGLYLLLRRDTAVAVQPLGGGGVASVVWSPR